MEEEYAVQRQERQIRKSPTGPWIGLGIVLFVLVVGSLLGVLFLFSDQSGNGRNASECDQFNNWVERFNCVKTLAIAERDPELCMHLSNDELGGTLRDNCYTAVAPELKDYSVCEIILEVRDDDRENYAKENNYDRCLMFTAQELNDIKTCQGRQNSEWCFMSIATATRDTSVCDLMPDDTANAFFTKENCYALVQQCIDAPELCGLSENSN